MKCEVCLARLEEYLDGELAAEDRELITAHVIGCGGCSSTFARLNAEQELFDRYDREIEVPPFLWTRVSQHTAYANAILERRWYMHFAKMFTPAAALASAIAIVLIALGFGLIQWMASPTPHDSKIAGRNQAKPVAIGKEQDSMVQPDSKPGTVASRPRRKSRVRSVIAPKTVNESDVLSSDLAYLDMDDRDTVKHIEQTQLLLRSIRNVPVSDGDEEIDVTYDKELSRRLLNENIVLRRDAEMKAKFPTKTLLADLEPFLIDIANLPDHARAEDVRVIKERVQKTEIVAALLDYQDRARTSVNQN